MSAALHNIRRPNLATTTVRVGTSYASLDLWYVDLDVSAGARGSFRHWLSDDELGRAERFHSDLDRSRYVVGRIALRRVLADRLGCSPAAVRFSYGRNGKPMLEGARGHLEFNLAHSGGDAVIALTECAAVGVDIELLRPVPDVESLARLVFSDAERRELELARDPVSAFLNGWTRKEAYVKALGLGLNPPRRKRKFAFCTPAARPTSAFTAMTHNPLESLPPRCAETLHRSLTITSKS